MAVTLEELATKSGARLAGDGAEAVVVTGVAPPATASHEELAYVADSRAAEAWHASEAAAALLPEKLEEARGARPALIATNIRLALAHILEAFPPPTDVPPDIAPSATIHPSAQLGADAGIGPGVVIEAHVLIGARAAIGAGSYIGQDVEIGDDVFIHPQVYLAPRTLVNL